MKKIPVKYRKIRGLNRRKRAIEEWGDAYKSFDIDLVEQRKRDYVKFWVSPWSRLSLINSIYPEPTSDCKYLLIKNIAEIYQSWKDSLEAMQVPYYLQIWLYEEYLSRSQVVCAIEECKDFYQHTFERLDEQPRNGIQSSIHYNSDTAPLLDSFQWQFNRHIRAYDMTDEYDIEMFGETDPNKVLRKEIIAGKEYQIVEINKLWLIS